MPNGTTDADGNDCAPSPLAFVAEIVHVYVKPLLRFGTVIGVRVPATPCVTPPSLEKQRAV